MRWIMATMAGLSVASCGGTDQSDVRCYAAASVTLSANQGNADAAALMAYYLGRVDAADPGGGWAKAAGRTIGEFNQNPGQFEGLMSSCMDRMRASMAKQRAATQAVKADS